MREELPLLFQCFAGGTCFLLGGLGGLRRWHRAKHGWPKVEATVQRFGYDADRRRIATLAYEPAPGDRRVTVVLSSTSWGLGSVVTLAYNPKTPAQVVVVCGHPWWSYISIGVGAALVLVATVIL